MSYTENPPPMIGCAIPPVLPQWTNRRRVINRALLFCGSIVGMVVVSACAALFISMKYKIAIDNNIIQLLTTILYTTAFVSTSIIGSYVFGSNFDHANSRMHISDFLLSGADDCLPVTPKRAKPPRALEKDDHHSVNR